MRVLEIWINCPDDETADSIAESLIDLRLAACANKHQPVESSYRWKGNIEFEPEIPLVVKTREDLFDKVVEAVRSIHPYETPSILGVPVEFVNADYRDWVLAETS